MTLTASNIEHGFLALLALSLLLECALTILHTHAAERAREMLPSRFEKKLSLAAHQKAADYTVDLAQAQLLQSFSGAGAALLLTYGQGLTVIAAFMGALFDNSIAAQWGTIAAVTLFLALVDFPFSWHLRCRIPQQYGYLGQSERAWLARRAKETLAGWLIELPLIAVLLACLEAAGERWWLVGWALWCAYLLWRWKVQSVQGIFWGRRAEPVADPAARRMVADFLASIGMEMKDFVIMTRPAGWQHSHVVLAGWGRRRTVIVFAGAAAKLSREELLALIAHDCGHARHGHPWLRILLFAAAGWCVFRFAGWGSINDDFFEGFGFSPYVTLAREGSHAGFVIAVAIAVFPILFYPLRPLVNLFARQMQYDADAYAAKHVGGNALIRALVKLHRDYATTLAPSRLFSLFHYRRPHAGMRVAAIISLAERGKISLDGPSASPPFDMTPYLEPGLPPDKQPVVMPSASRSRGGSAPEAGGHEALSEEPLSKGLPDEEALPPEAWLGEDATPAAEGASAGAAVDGAAANPKESASAPSLRARAEPGAGGQADAAQAPSNPTAHQEPSSHG